MNDKRLNGILISGFIVLPKTHGRAEPTAMCGTSGQPCFVICAHCFSAVP